MKKYLIILIDLSFSTLAFAQENSVSKLVKGFVNQTEFGILLGRATPIYSTAGVSKLNFTMLSFNGYKFNNRFSAGVTVGLDWYTSYQVVPIEAGFRLDFPSKKRVSLYFGLDAGYGFMWLQNPPTNYTYQGGFTYNPSVGLKIDLGKDSFLSISIGYKYQKASNKYIGTNDYQVENFSEYNRFVLRTGICF